MNSHSATSALLSRFKELRKSAGISESDLEKILILGPGWVSKIETGEVIPRLNTLLALLNSVGADLPALIREIDISRDTEIDRQIASKDRDDGLLIRFPYGKFDAEYLLHGATQNQFSHILKRLRNGLAKLAITGEVEAVKAEAVARAFLEATKLWPHVNPTDIWWFIISRAYCDPLNHPAEFTRLDLGQSWKRTSGWALEIILVQHYSRYLRKNGVNLSIAKGERKVRLVEQLKTNDRIEADKVDVLLTGKIKGMERCFGVVHVKASFAERRTDDVPMSKSLIEVEYTSPLWTMDCKSMPNRRPYNKGELGKNWSGESEQKDNRSAKRKDIEDDGYFSACFSYNQNTEPTPIVYQKSKARIYICNFRNPNDVFSRYVINEWNEFKSKVE